jgi:hypothetical protein
MAQTPQQQPSVALSTTSNGRKLNENKPGEPAFQMKIEPDSILSFRAPAGGFQPTTNPNDQKGAVNLELKITNTTKHRQTYKVKCTNNEIFRVRPPIGFLNPDQTIVLKVSFQATNKVTPENNKHFFAIYHFKTDEPGPQARPLWTAAVKPEGVKRILAQFENPDGTLVGSSQNQQHSTDQNNTK